MGLDINAYRGLTEAIGEPDDGECPPGHFYPGVSMEWSETHFPGRGEGVKAKQMYRYKERYSFRAGSYSGYNDWRDLLDDLSEQLIIDRPEPQPGPPFMELINFADNEGVIGPIVSAKLAKDFADNAEAAAKFSPDDYFLDKYREWQKAFTMAADNGAVEFR